MTWETGSPVYTAIKSHGVPKCQDVATDSPVMAPVYFMSPTNVRLTKDVVGQSTAAGSAPPTPAKRNLFGAANTTETLLDSPINTTVASVMTPVKTIGEIAKENFSLVNQLTTNVPRYIEISQLIYITNR